MRLLRRDQQRIDSPVDLHGEFRAAWDRLEIHAQDIHGTTDGSIYATEALLRWRRNPGELWAAAMVLPIAEDTGTVELCTTWATELSLTAWASSASRKGGGRLALNLHRTQLANDRVAAEISMNLDRLGLHPSELVLEIPDQLGPDGCKAAVDRLGPLIDEGARIALDDHRGSASETQPHPVWLPLGSLVKLDTALLMAADEPVGREILEITADSLHADGYEIVAEAVERPSQLAAVIQCRIAWAQGYLFARPQRMV